MDGAGGLDTGVSVASCGGGAALGFSNGVVEHSFAEINPWVTIFKPESA